MTGQTFETSDRSEPIDDCWNRIGISGDRSCECLAGHVHCRNCPVYTAAAVAMLERYEVRPDDRRDDAPAVEEDESRRLSVLVFRVRDQWLGLATGSLLEVAPLTPVHSLPHHRSGAILGVTNVRGFLAACVSLPVLLGIQGGDRAYSERRVLPMMLVLDAAGGAIAAPVDEVDGVHAIPLRRIVEAGGDDAGMASRFASGVLRWRERSITLLDADGLVQVMVRSLA